MHPEQGVRDLYQSAMQQQQSDSELISGMRLGNNSSKEQSIAFLELAKLHLIQYQDINEKQFELIEQPQNVNMENIPQFDSRNYMKPHTTFVPIGTNFQTQIPDLMSSAVYLRGKDNLNNLQRLKGLNIHQPKQNNKFYKEYKGKIDHLFGGDRSYEDISLIRNAIINTASDFMQPFGFNEYFEIPKACKFWKDYFRQKDLQVQRKLKKKKKKKVGSLDF